MICFLNEMELTDKLIKQYATEHDCDETTAANIFRLTAARLTAESLADNIEDLDCSLLELWNITNAINPLIHNSPSKRENNHLKIGGNVNTART